MVLPTSYTKDKVDELACTYAALILHDEGISITADKIKDLTVAANITVEPFWPTLFAKFFAKVKVSDILSNIGGSPAGAVAAPTGGAAAVEEKQEEEKKPESEEEEEEDAFGGLF
ncbi:hypothetical protein ABK040_009885 [Willaertia magna]